MRTCLFLTALTAIVLIPSSSRAGFQAGAAVIDVTPIKLPAEVNGNLVGRKVGTIKTRLHARAIVLDDGKTRLAIVVVDSCAMPQNLLDEVKLLVAKKTQIKPDRMLISATHCHSAPSVMGTPGVDADEAYIPLLRTKIVEAIVAAEENLEPAQVGFARTQAAEFTALRRWIRRPDRLETDPFGNPTVRASMHAAGNWDNVIGPSGPEDPELAMISIQSTSGRPLAVLANFSMHYFSGEKGISADYFGLFCEGLKDRLRENRGDAPPFVGVMSHGCSGDIWRRDYALPPKERPGWDINEYAEQLQYRALSALENVKYQPDIDLAMTETRMRLNYRVPNQQRLEWAQKIVDEMGDRLLENQREFYAVQQLKLHEWQSTEIVVQALRIGDIGIATTPNETYALTGLKLKLQSPLEKTFIIELANGSHGYIPPPEQHLLGGYNTWEARSAGLEVTAEPKITEAALRSLERVSGRRRRVYQQSRGPAAETIAALKPAAWWRLDEWSGPHAADSAGDHDGVYEPAVAFFLDGPDGFCKGSEPNRSAHFAGGRLRTRLKEIGADAYSVSLWFWNGMPTDGRAVPGWMFSRGDNFGLGTGSDHVGLGGQSGYTGQLIYQHGDGTSLTAGQTEIKRWTWNHVVFVRDADRVRIYLNGGTRPEIDAQVSSTRTTFPDFFFGGRSDIESNWEGRLDEVAVFARALKAGEIMRLSRK